MTWERGNIGKETDKNIKGMIGMQFMLTTVRVSAGSLPRSLWENFTPRISLPDLKAPPKP